MSHEAAPAPGGRSPDHDRIEHLFQSYFGELCSFVHGMVASPETAEELVQDVFAAIWRQRAERPLGEIERAYLYTAARRNALNNLRRARLQQRWTREATAAPRSSVPTPEEETAVREMERSVERVLERLPPRCREAFLLVRGRGLRHAEAAEVMGISAKTVEAQMGRALQALRAALLQSSS